MEDSLKMFRLSVRLNKRCPNVVARKWLISVYVCVIERDRIRQGKSFLSNAVPACISSRIYVNTAKLLYLRK